MCDKNSDLRISCAGLSTGEKVLLSLAMLIYSLDTDTIKPDLLLIDEPDAGMHPSMSKKIVDVLQEFIVDKLGIPVVITTHSPTTIAALDDVAIFEKKRGLNAPEKIFKDEALAVLTEGIPFLAVSIEKRRAVFVESHYDAEIMSDLYEIYKGNILTEPHFFPLHKGKGSNCVDVMRSAEHFLKCGDANVYGIIDWDNDANRISKDNLLVLGDGERYAIENYILDPLLVGLFLIYQRKKDFAEFGVCSISTTYELSKIDNDDCQKIIDGIIAELGFDRDQKASYVLCNEWTLQTAQSILSMRGHDLEVLYKSKFPCLNAYNSDSQKDKNLKRQIVDAVVKQSHGTFLSKSMLSTLLCIM